MMVQQTPQQSITIQLTHDLVQIAGYSLGYWEGFRGGLIQCQVTVGVGPGLASVLNVTLEPTLGCYINTQSPFMNSSLAPVTIPGVASISPISVNIPVQPLYPGLGVLRITAKAGGVRIPIHSVRGVSFAFNTWFYIVEREAVVQVALNLAETPK